MKKVNLLYLYIIFGAILGISGILLACVWFGWKLGLVIFICQWGNNICNNSSKNI